MYATYKSMHVTYKSVEFSFIDVSNERPIVLHTIFSQFL